MTKLTDDMRHHRMYIDGAFVESQGGGRIDVESPTTEEVVYSVPDGGVEDARVCVASRVASATWLGGDARGRARTGSSRDSPR